MMGELGEGINDKKLKWKTINEWRSKHYCNTKGYGKVERKRPWEKKKIGGYFCVFLCRPYKNTITFTFTIP